MAFDPKYHLGRQLAFLQRSSASYDAGEKDEAIRIATVIRVLLHQTRNSVALLTHLGAWHISLLSTGSPNAAMPGVIYAMALGVVHEDASGTSYVPDLSSDLRGRVLAAEQWWNEIVYVLPPDFRLTRKMIVLAAANKDGGAHVDSKLTPEYEALAADGAIGGWYAPHGDGVRAEPFTDAHLVAIRQMASELLNSPQLIGLA